MSIKGFIAYCRKPKEFRKHLKREVRETAARQFGLEKDLLRLNESHISSYSIAINYVNTELAKIQAYSNSLKFPLSAIYAWAYDNEIIKNSTVSRTNNFLITRPPCG